MSNAPIIYVVDDNPGCRDSTTALVSQMAFQVKAFSSAEEFLADYRGHRPCCLLTDHRMEGMSGVKLVESLRASGITLAAVIMTAFADTQLTVRAIRGGAVTLLDKPFDYKSLREVIEQALSEDQIQYEQETKLREIQLQFDSLTTGELDVVKRIVQGMANKVVASELDVSIRTVESRRSKIFYKMHVTSVAGLVQLAMLARPELCLVENLNTDDSANTL